MSEWEEKEDERQEELNKMAKEYANKLEGIIIDEVIEEARKGGHVYPGQVSNPPHPQDVPGITRRDWLAGLAMQGMLVNPERKGDSTEEVVLHSYELADAVILEGNK